VVVEAGPGIRDWCSDRYEEMLIDARREAPGGRKSHPGDDRVLRAKYLDWCSARLAERFLRLTPDEIYELAHQASHTANDAAGDVSASMHHGENLDARESFRSIVEQVTEVLASTLPLPSFDDWLGRYRESPDRYDRELLGFWKEGAPPGKEESGGG
jgi:hypothetical protein